MKILVAVDEDPLFEDVLATLRWCVRLGGSDHVLVLHAVPVFPWMRGAMESSEDWAAMVRGQDERAERVLSAARRLLSSWNIESEFICCEDYAAKEILRVAHEREVDLIVVGARGSEERGFLVGSVSQKVKALAQTDVLVVRRGRPLESNPFRALLAVDGSPESIGAVESFARNMQADRAEVRLIHVVDLPLTVWDFDGTNNPLDVASLPEALREQVDRALAEALTVLRRHGIDATREVRKGRAAAEILNASLAHRAHLVVMGSRGLSAIRGLLLGSVTQRVVRHGMCSVLIGRPSAYRQAAVGLDPDTLPARRHVP